MFNRLTAIAKFIGYLKEAVFFCWIMINSATAKANTRATRAAPFYSLDFSNQIASLSCAADWKRGWPIWSPDKAVAILNSSNLNEASARHG